MFRKCHVLSTLKTPCNSSFWVVRRRPVTRLNFPPLSNPQFFQWQSKSPSLTGPFVTVYILIYCLLTCFRPEYAWNICHWTLNNNQSINHWVGAISKHSTSSAGHRSLYNFFNSPFMFPTVVDYFRQVLQISLHCHSTTHPGRGNNSDQISNLFNKHL